MHKPDRLQVIALDAVEDEQLPKGTFDLIGAQGVELRIAKMSNPPEIGGVASFLSDSSNADWNRDAISAPAFSTYQANWISKSVMKNAARWIARLIAAAFA